MTSFAIKILAIITMTIDHIGYAYKIIPFRAIGRIAFPLFAFQVAIGFRKTSNKQKYILRMIIFTIISQIPYILFSKTSMPNLPVDLNVGATFTIALLALWLFEKIDNNFLKCLSVFVMLALAQVIPCDYSAYGVAMVLCFYFFQDNKKLMLAMFCLLALEHLFVVGRIYYIATFIAAIPIALYNGQKGKSMKYLFYAYYPLHMLAIWAAYTYL